MGIHVRALTHTAHARACFVYHVLWWQLEVLHASTKQDMLPALSQAAGAVGLLLPLVLDRIGVKVVTLSQPSPEYLVSSPNLTPILLDMPIHVLSPA
jgi:hypothetical protein